MLTLPKSDPRSAAECAAAMNRGEVVIIPTDTVYGLSAIANSPFAQDDEGAALIRSIKGRDEKKPFIVLIEKPSDIFQYTNDAIPQSLLSLWPCALTIVVKAHCKAMTGGEVSQNDGIPSAIALRCPKDEWLRRVIALCKKPIYSTSANISGSAVLHTIQEIQNAFAASNHNSSCKKSAASPWPVSGPRVGETASKGSQTGRIEPWLVGSPSRRIEQLSRLSLLIDDGDKTAMPSTIVSVTDGKIVVLRQGEVEVRDTATAFGK